MLKLCDTFKNDKFENIINYNRSLKYKITNLEDNKNVIFDNVKDKFINGENNAMNILNRLYLINELIESLDIELNELNDDYSKILNLNLNNKVKNCLNDEEYSKFILKPFIPYMFTVHK
jgi:hypothetical protein